MRWTIVLLALSLAACDRWKPTYTAPVQPTEAQEAAAQVSDFSKPMLARGNEPFWALKMQGTSFTLTRPDQPDVAFAAPGAKITPGKAIWEARSANGQALTATLYVSDCSDGMSDMRYPFTAEVALGEKTLRGCAAKLSDLPKAAARP